jgi:hypothetical protein
MSDSEIVDRARRAEGFDVRMLAHGDTLRTRAAERARWRIAGPVSALLVAAFLVWLVLA